MQKRVLHKNKLGRQRVGKTIVKTHTHTSKHIQKHVCQQTHTQNYVNICTWVLTRMRMYVKNTSTELYSHVLADESLQTDS
jgi:hypothetical protein